MTMETITLRVDSRTAQAFQMATDEERRKVEALVSLRLLEVVHVRTSLKAVMRRMSRQAQARGLTPEILQDILNDTE
jgi:hypothetical protein